MLQYFNTDIVLQNIREIRDTFRPLLRREAIETVQEYLRKVQRTRNEETTFVRSVRPLQEIKLLPDYYLSL